MISDKDLLSRQQARQMAQKAREAFTSLSKFSQAQIDTIIDAIAQAADREAENLARMAVEETGYGNIPDKITKNRFASRDVYRFVRPLKTVGMIGEDTARKVLLIAEPVGVVAAILPSTNPTSTAIYKVLISIKGRNTIVLSPHPSAKNCICRAAEIMMEAARAAGAPEGSICCLTDVSHEGTQELMQDRNVSVILATGGMGIVRLAYSSGKPAFGVGPGNVPAFIERSANIPKAVSDILRGKTFDHGVLCSSEQSLIYETVIRDQVMNELQKHKVYICNDAEMAALAKVMVTPTYGINPRVVGKTPSFIAAQAGFQVPSDTRALIVPLKGVGKDYPLSIEKLSPVLALYEVSDFNQGIELCNQLLRFGGMGHTMSFHSNNRDLILQVGLRCPAFRIIINSPATHGSVGLTTGLDPAMTLGCGAVGGNITSDNISPLHLINIKRVAFEMREAEKIGFAPNKSPANALATAPATPPSGSLEEKIYRFLEQRTGRQSPVMSPPSTASANPETGTIQWGQHKIYPILPPQSSSTIHTPSEPSVSMIGPVDFICEEDVRQALAKKQVIGYHSKTIITPAAQDLAFNKGVLKKVD